MRSVKSSIFLAIHPGFHSHKAHKIKMPHINVKVEQGQLAAIIGWGFCDIQNNQGQHKAKANNSYCMRK